MSGNDELAAERVALSGGARRNYSIVSSDLSAASDTLATSLLESMVKGLSDSKVFPDWVLKLLWVLIGP